MPDSATGSVLGSAYDAASESAAARPARAGKAALLEFSAPCPASFEQELAAELRRLGCSRVRPLKGSVSFAGDVAIAQRVCLWSRLASRVTLVLKRIDASDSEELYEGARRIAWEEHIAPDATFAVRVRGGNDELHDQRFSAVRVKDAIADRMRESTGARPNVDTVRPDLLVTCAIHGQRATLGIDLAGESLMNRGYRVSEGGRGSATSTAYLREDLASLLLEKADWPRRSARDSRAVLVDPLGTSAVLAVEAACIACDRAPGLLRSHWGFDGWLGFDEQAWADEIERADDRFERGLERGKCVVVASADPGMRHEIERMAKKARVESAIRIIAGGPADIDLGDSPLPGSVVCCVVPEAGSFGLTSDQPARLAAVGALAHSAALAEAPVAALSSGDELGFALASSPESVTRVMNGSSPATICVYPSAGRIARMAAQRSSNGPSLAGAEGTAGTGGAERAIAEGTGHAGDAGSAKEAGKNEGSSRGAGAGSLSGGPFGTVIELPDGSSLNVLVPSSSQFADRLAKVWRQGSRWARRHGITCFRIYDSDMPDYAVSIDLYQGSATTPGSWLVMSEYAAPREIDPQLASRRLADAMAIAPRVLGIPPENVFLKVRRRERGGSQYSSRAQDRKGRTALVEEGGLVFEVNFTDYLDTGIFLDNRLVRERIREMADGQRFLNLFAYTGTASVYAADGNAYTTTTVDMSGPYLEWARRNMEQNGFSGRAHEFVQEDVIQWVGEQRHTPHRWGLIYIDPPTFSNSARMRRRGFDIQRDHAELLIGASRLLARDGQIVFSCNLRGFKPDVEALERAGVEIDDITGSTIPEDFSRNARVHHCYIVRRSE
jgi:23S rRNA (guanine2445-N2)-methyltransferase / 23S rRNA (guanine2069-N7)-methyltransferase